MPHMSPKASIAALSDKGQDIEQSLLQHSRVHSSAVTLHRSYGTEMPLKASGNDIVHLIGLERRGSFWLLISYDGF